MVPSKLGDNVIRNKRRLAYTTSACCCPGRKARRLTSGSWRLPKQFCPSSPSFAVSRRHDGKFIASLSRKGTRNREPVTSGTLHNEWPMSANPQTHETREVGRLRPTFSPEEASLPMDPRDATAPTKTNFSDLRPRRRAGRHAI